MEQLIGLKITFECSACGSRISTKCLAADINSLKIGICAPELCSCGNKRNFKIQGLEQVDFIEKRGEQ